MTYRQTDHLPLIHRVSLDRPHHQIGLADRPPEPFRVPRTPAKVPAPSNPVRDFMRFFALMSVVGERLAAFLQPVSVFINRLEHEYQAARKELS